MRFLFAMFVLLATTLGSFGAELKLPPGRAWALFATSTDLDEAIGDARAMQEANARVVRLASGTYAAVAGPYDVPAGRATAVLADLKTNHSFPAGTALTRGETFVDLAWQPAPSRELATLAYDGTHDARLVYGKLDIRLTRTALDKDSNVPVAIGTFEGKPAFRMRMTENGTDTPAAQVRIVKLDPHSAQPQVVFTYFWQGAHCCAMTRIATLMPSGQWHVVEGETLDGDGGYRFEDLDGDGASELLSVDQSFLYAFDSYAGSAAPMRLHALSGDQLVDVTREAVFRHRLAQDLASQEFFARSQDQTNGNGFLAGWVAGSILVGKGETAWAAMLKSYDHHPEFGPEVCRRAVPIEKCPEGQSRRLSFPYALRQFLVDHAYIAANAAGYKAPRKFEPGDAP